MEITLEDLLVLEPRLIWGDASNEPADTSRRAGVVISWVVSARITPPHLPPLRGGEVLLVSERAAAAVGAALPALVREAQFREASAVVFEGDGRAARATYPWSDELDILFWTEVLNADTETGINRLLTECRGNLYRVGSEFERQMTDLAANRSAMSAVVDVAAELSGLPVLVVDAQRRRLTTATLESADDVQTTSASFSSEGGIERELPGGLTLVLAPLRPEQCVLARFLVDRIAAAVGDAARRDDAARPRGTRRTEALAVLLKGAQANSADQRATAMNLGLDPDGVFFVAVANGANDSMLAKALGPLGVVHPAGEDNGSRATLIAVNSRAGAESLASRVSDIKRRWAAANESGDPTLALSAPAHGVARLPAAAMEATFVATLQAQTPFPLRAASFESIEDVGAFRLLYQLRDSNELRKFVSEALGTLECRDQRGTLRSTLRAFLESGGSQVDASHRLGIHRNTLAYRLRRIGELIGRDVADPGSWLTLHLALRASEMLDLFSDERPIR